MILVEPLLAWRFPFGLTVLGAAVAAVCLTPLIGLPLALIVSTAGSIAAAIRLQRPDKVA